MNPLITLLALAPFFPVQDGLLHRDVRVLDLAGTPYERGLAHGRALKDEIRELVGDFQSDLERTYGVEASVEFDLAPRSVRSYSVPVNVSYTYTVSEFQTSFVSSFEPWGTVQAGDRLPYLPAHQLSASLGWEQPRWHLGFFGNYTSKAATEALQGDIPDNKGTDARVVLDASAEYVLTSSTRMFVSMQNLTDKEYVAARRPAGVRPGLPRRLVAGIKFSF